LAAARGPAAAVRVLRWPSTVTARPRPPACRGGGRPQPAWAAGRQPCSDSRGWPPGRLNQCRGHGHPAVTRPTVTSQVPSSSPVSEWRLWRPDSEPLARARRVSAAARGRGPPPSRASAVAHGPNPAVTDRDVSVAVEASVRRCKIQGNLKFHWPVIQWLRTVRHRPGLSDSVAGRPGCRSRPCGGSRPAPPRPDSDFSRQAPPGAGSAIGGGHSSRRQSRRRVWVNFEGLARDCIEIMVRGRHTFFKIRAPARGQWSHFRYPGHN
jgi:hypothetical protein